MTYLIRVTCPNCGRDYRYSSDAPENEMLCPFSDCLLVNWHGEDDEEDEE